MAQRKFRLAKLRELHKTLGDLIAESDATLEGGTTESDDAGNGNGAAQYLEQRDQPGAQDSTHVPAVTRAHRQLEAIPGYDRLRKNAVQPLPKSPDLFAK